MRKSGHHFSASLSNLTHAALKNIALRRGGGHTGWCGAGHCQRCGATLRPIMWRGWPGFPDHRLSGGPDGGLYGVLYRAVAGYAGGRTDQLMMRMVEVLYGFPYVILVILLSLLFGGGNVALFAAIVFTLWLTPAVIVRAQAQSLSKREFAEAARAGGMTPWQIVLEHIVPNCASVVVVYGALLVPEVILSESFLSFLGIGIKEPQASWGNLIQTGTSAMDTDLRLLLLPGVLLAMVLFCLNFIADGLRDAFDPNDH